MKNPRPSTNSSSSPSFALISVLALVSLAALTATAFLASARLERQATMPLTQTTMLDMALDSGAVAALRLLECGAGEQFNHVVTYWRGTNTDDWTNELGYLLIGSLQSNDITSNPLKVKYYFCFSSAALTNLGTNLIEYTNHQSAGDQARFNRQINNGLNTAQRGTNFAAGQSTNIPLLGDTPANRFTSPPVGWVYINQDVRVKPGQTNTTNVPVTRFAFYVQDLSSMIDAERMGGFTNGTPYRESTALPTNYTQGTNPAEISLTNLTGTALTIATIASNFTSTNYRRKYLSPGMLILSKGGGLNTNDLRYVTTGLRHWTNAYERIPFGLGYSNCGTTDKGTNKYSLATGGNVADIAATITTNLPNFGDRSGAMNSAAYISNIAANIVDYVDADSTPSADSGANPTYLGIENIPWPNEIFTQLKHLGVTSAGILQIQMTDYLEVWNMGDKAITNSPTITMSNNYDLLLTMTNTLAGASFKTNLNALTGMGGANNSKDFALSGTLLPNSYKVLTTTTNTHTLQITNPSLYSSAAIRNAWAIFAAEADATTNMSYTASIGTNVIQKTISGRWTRFLSPTNKMTPPSGLYIFCNNIGYASQTAINGVPAHTGGDPRAQLFLSGALYNQNYTNKYASPGGRNVGRYQITNYPESEVNPLKFWPDNGHANSADYGGNPTAFSSSQDPTDFPPLDPPLTNNWVMKRNDTGALTNIIELGNIYDPMQWSDQAGSGVANQPGLWTNLTTAAIPDARFGGRNTLRIGRAEHQRFAWTKPAAANNSDPFIPNMQMSAAALLDLFCLSNQFDEGGKINLNTAPAPVLRALAGGVYLRSDPNLTTGTDPKVTNANYPIPAEMAEAFAQGVMRFRSKYPFYSPSQLSFIGTDPTWPNTTNWPSNAVFGNTNAIALSAAPGNSLSSASNNVSEWNDQAAEEWFAKIFKLSTVYSRNFRVYVIAQKATNQGGTNIGVGPVVRKYYNVLIRQNGSDAGDAPGASPVTSFQSYY